MTSVPNAFSPDHGTRKEEIARNSTGVALEERERDTHTEKETERKTHTERQREKN